MSVRFSRIDGEALKDHSRLTEHDECYYLFEYTSGKDYTFGKANNLISNLKKEPKFKDRPDVWRHKLRAIDESAGYLNKLIKLDWLRRATLVPVPPSKAKDSPEYDDRMLQVLKKMDVGFEIDIRELVYQRESIRASHVTDERVTVEELLDVYVIDEDLCDPEPTVIGIFDDVVTTGAHYQAMTTVLKERFPNVDIIGIFMARRIFPPENVEDFFDTL